MKEQTNGERFEEFMKVVNDYKYPELEGTMNLCNDIIEKRTGKMTEEEWQAAEKGLPFKQFSLYEHKETITSADTITSSQTEISDEEIEKAWSIVETTHVDKWVSFKSMFIEGAKWYREQLKQRQ